MKHIGILLLLLSLNTFASEKTICGPTDDRDVSFDTKIGRASASNKLVGCTVTMIGKSCAISAGHCVGALEKVSFNVPLSDDSIPNQSKPVDVYYRTKDFLRYKDNGPGNDWAVIRLKKNRITGLFPGDVQGSYKVQLNSLTRRGDTVRITGFGVDNNDPDKTFAQQTHIGQIKGLGTWIRPAQLKHSVDTMGGNSGSSIMLESTDEIIGIHSHGGCRNSGGANAGTLIAKNKILKQVIQQCLIWESEL